MQLHKLHKHALELEQSGGGRGGAEVEGLGGGKGWVEKGKGGCTMTLCANIDLSQQKKLRKKCLGGSQT